MKFEQKEFQREWLDIFDINSGVFVTLRSKLDASNRPWLRKLMLIPYLAVITEVIIKILMPRQLNILEKRAVKLLSKGRLPKAYWQRLLTMGNFPSDIIKTNVQKLHKLTDINHSERSWFLLGRGWIDLYIMSDGETLNPINYEILVTPTLKSIRDELTEAEIIIFDKLYLDIRKHAATKLKEIYSSIFSSELIFRNVMERLSTLNNLGNIGFSSCDILTITLRYPGLILEIRNWSLNCYSSYIDISRRFSNDSHLINEMFNLDINELSSVILESGDTHIDGKSACILIFKNGKKLCYKPRPLALEIAFSNLTSRACKTCNIPEFDLLPDSLDCGNWGYQEFVIRTELCEAEKQSLLVIRLAIVTFLLDIFGAIDCHKENLFLSGDRPILIDGETLFHSIDKPKSGFLLRDSILVTGFCDSLSPYICELINIASQGNNKIIDLYFSELSRLYYHKNLNKLLVYELSKLQKATLKRRIVFRSTSVYYKLRKRLISHSALKSVRVNNLIYEDLFWITIQSGKLQQSLLTLCRSESLQLERGWIPYFNTVIGDPKLTLFGKFYLNAGLHKNVLSFSKHRLYQRNAGGGVNQIRIIQSLFKLFPGPQCYYGQLNSENIVNDLIDIALIDDPYKWLFGEYSDNKGYFEFSCPDGLYDGSLGIAILLHLFIKCGFSIQNQHSCRTIEQNIRLDNEKYIKLIANINHLNNHQLGIASGLGGRILALILMRDKNNMSDNSTLSVIKIIEMVIEIVNERDINDYGGLDVISGLSGFAGSVNAWSILSNIPSDNSTINSFWAIVGNILVDKQKECGGWDVFDKPINGFSHGTSGMICALAIAWNKKSNPNLLSAIEGAIQFELRHLTHNGEWLDIQSSSNNNTQIPIRTWCGGAPGALIAAAVLKNAGLDQIKGYKQWLTAARSASLNYKPERDQICCGLPGWFMSLAVAGHALNDNNLIIESKRTREKWIDDVKLGKNLDLRQIKSTNFSPPGLFVGRAGVGLILLDNYEVSMTERILISSGYLEIQPIN